MNALCEWNPVENRPATNPPCPTDCRNEAQVCVGSKGQWHLCESCALMPHFGRFKRRVPLDQKQRKVDRRMEMRTWWVVMKVIKWDALCLNNIQNTPLGRPIGGMLGFLPVFDTEEAARLEYPRDEIMQSVEVPR